MKTETSTHDTADTQDINLYDYYRVILSHRKFITTVVVAGFLLSLLVSLLLPNVYVATARVLPPRETKPGLSALMSGTESPLAGLAGELIGTTTPATLYVGIMKSRTVADAIIAKFDLRKKYDFEYIEDVYDKLNDRTAIELSKKDQIISITVKDKDPRQAADMANTYVEMLDRINRKLNITQGQRKRVFLEERLKEVRVDLEKAELALKTFQEQYHLVAIKEQAKVAIEGAAEIKGQIIAAQTELQVLKQFGTEQQNEAVMLKARIRELEKQLSAIEQGRRNGPPSAPLNEAASEMGSNFYIPFNDLPKLGMELMRLTRNAKIQEKLFELLSAQFEMAQIEEAKDVDTIQVLDRAVTPEKKAGPKRLFMVASTIIISLLSAVFSAFVLEYFSLR